jgi:hypothetical protein
MTRPSPEALLEEAARLAYHYHWPLETILDMEHEDRRRFLRAAEEMSGFYGPVDQYVQGPTEETWE